MTAPNEPTPGTGPPRQAPAHRQEHADAPDALLPGEVARPLKAVGLIGYVLLLVAIALIAVVLAALALDWPLTGWITAAAVATVLAVACLVGSRLALTSQPAHDRSQHDPLIPETTQEEAREYERAHPHPHPRREP